MEIKAWYYLVVMFLWLGYTYLMDVPYIYNIYLVVGAGILYGLFLFIKKKVV